MAQAYEINEGRVIYKPRLSISKIAPSMVDQRPGMPKDFVLTLSPGGTETPVHLRVTAPFAGYLATEMTRLAESPKRVVFLETIAQDKTLLQETRLILTTMVNVARAQIPKIKEENP